MPLSLVEGALGGIGLFLLGMRLMSDGIRTVADSRIRIVFAALTSNRFTSFLFGAVLALAVNSGSAAVIITFGLVNGGVLNAFQAMSVLGGVFFGASLSLHLNFIPYSLISTPLIFTGVLLKFFARRRRLANSGDLLLGVGLLFLGLTLLEGSYRPFDQHPFYALLGTYFYHNGVLAAFFGALVSFLVQSANSTISVVNALYQGGHVSLEIASNMVTGGLVGITAMGCMAAIGGTTVTRRVALALMCMTVAVVLLLAPAVAWLVDAAAWLGDSTRLGGYCVTDQLISCQIIWVHSIASMLLALMASLLSGVVSRLVLQGVTFRDGTGSSPQPCAGYLDTRILSTPLLAIEQVRKEILRMTSVTVFMYADVRDILSDFDSRRAETIRQHEQVLDSLNHEITVFMAALARTATSAEISFEIPGLFQVVTDLEHIGDRCEGILNTIVAKKEAGIVFSDEAMDDLKNVAIVVGTVMAATEESIRTGVAPEVGELRTAKLQVRTTFDEVKQAHFDRICRGVCPPRAAMLYNEITSSFMAIAELSWNILGLQGRKG